MIVCSVDLCESKRDGTSKMCGKHRRRLRLYGDVKLTKNRKPGQGFYASGYKAAQVDGVKKFDHVRIVENVLGKSLPKGCVVHHANGDRSDNRKENLVVCQDRAYHNLLHARMSAINATGDASKRKCRHCKNYDSLTNLTSYKCAKTTSYWHKECAIKYQRERRKNDTVL